MTEPTTTDAAPSHSTRRDPYAAVTYSTPRTARFDGSGARRSAICTIAPSQAIASESAGESRLTASAAAMIPAISGTSAGLSVK